jgi:hypothetical protein
MKNLPLSKVYQLLEPGPAVHIKHLSPKESGATRKS